MELSGASFHELMDRARDGDERAAQIIYEQYQPHIIKIARRFLASRVRSKFDPDDAAQLVWKSFFRRKDGLMAGVENPSQLMALLGAMARNKATDENRKRTTAKFGVDREQPLNESASDTIRRSHETPSKFAVANETYRHMKDGRSERDQQILDLRVSSESLEEIAEKLCISERTVRRVIKSLADEVEP